MEISGAIRMKQLYKRAACILQRKILQIWLIFKYWDWVWIVDNLLQGKHNIIIKVMNLIYNKLLQFFFKLTNDNLQEWKEKSQKVASTRLRNWWTKNIISRPLPQVLCHRQLKVWKQEPEKLDGSRRPKLSRLKIQAYELTITTSIEHLCCQKN